MTTPRTAAGRALLAIHRRSNDPVWQRRIRAIEGEAATLERERITSAFTEVSRWEKQHGDYLEPFIRVNDVWPILTGGDQ